MNTGGAGAIAQFCAVLFTVSTVLSLGPAIGAPPSDIHTPGPLHSKTCTDHVTLQAAATGEAEPPTRYLVCDFPDDDPAVTRFLERAAARLRALGAAPQTIVLLNAGTVIPNGTGRDEHVLSRYHVAIDRIYLAYDRVRQVVSDHVATGADRWTVGESPLDQLQHEIGHHVYFQRLDAATRREWDTQVWGRAFGRTVSHYAGLNAVDGFAECYSAFVSGAWLPKAAEQFIARTCCDKRPRSRRTGQP